RHFLHERRGMRERRDLARQIGRDLARLHAEGFNHPDLYAKHVFISAGDQTIYFLDWQRSRHGVISESRRLRDLAALEATLAETLVSRTERFACWRAYVEESSACRFATDTKRQVRIIERTSRLLLRKRHIRWARLPASADAQELIWLNGEALCIT